MSRFRFSQHPDNLLIALYTLISLSLWCFVWVHAFKMDMTHDEAYSYFLIKTNYFKAMFGSANTHWLNSFFMEIWQNLFGDKPGWLRLHSVMAFPFFAYAVFQLGKLINGMSGKIAFYALVLFNPYVLDFFSLARGYGLAMTFQAWSLLFFIRAAGSAFAWRAWMWVLVFNGLTIGANLSYFYTVVGMAGYAAWLYLPTLLKGRPAAAGLPKLILLFALLLLLTVADLLFIKYYGKDLGYGGDDNFVASLFGSVWNGTLYRVVNPALATWLSYISFLLVGGIAAWYLYRWIRSRQISTGMLIAIPLISIIALNILLHGAMKNPYLLFRTALQWYVPGMLLVCFAFSSWNVTIPLVRWSGTVVAGLVVFIFAGQFIKNVHFAWCFEWQLQANSQKALYDLYAQPAQRRAVGYSLAGVYANYYSRLEHAPVPAPTYLPDEGAPVNDTALIKVLQESDYVVSAHAVTIQCLEKLGLRYDVLQDYPPGRNVLIRIYHP